jgi:hypothetical protein
MSIHPNFLSLHSNSISTHSKSAALAAGRWSFTAGVAALLLLSAAGARADQLSVGAGLWSDVGTGTEIWNIDTRPSGSLSLTVPVSNATATGSQTATFFGWALSIEIVPQSGASGSLSISSLANPANNALTGSPGTPSDVVVNPAGPNTYNAISNSNTNATGSKVPTSGDNLVSFDLTSSNASGNFKLIAFNDSSDGYSNWTYYNGGNPGDPNNGNTFAYTNIPASGSFPASPAQFVLGTIDVVPEPGSLLLAALAVVGFAGYGRHRRSAGEPLPVADGV